MVHHSMIWSMILSGSNCRMADSVKIEDESLCILHRYSEDVLADSFVWGPHADL